MSCRIPFIFSALCLILNSGATSYYISSSEGNDTNSGTSAEAPWRKLNKIYLKGISASKFAAGDSILLKAGDTFEGTLWYLGSNGTSNARITIDRYGTGPNPIIIGDNPSIVWSAVPGHVGVYSGSPLDTFASGIIRIWDLSGNMYRKTNSTGGDTLDSFLDKIVPGYWGYSIGLNQTNLYIATFDGNAPVTGQLRVLQDVAVNLQHDVAHYLTVQNLDIRRVLRGINGSQNRGFKALSNSLQNCFSVGIFYLNNSSDGEIAYNTCTLGGWTQIYQHTGSNIWIHHNNISYSTNRLLEITNVGVQIHGSSELSGIGLERGINNVVEYNTISFVQQGGVDYYYESGSVLRYNYLFSCPTAAVVPQGCGLRVHHNIFHVNGGRGMGGLKIYNSEITTGPDTGDNYVYNNIFYGMDGAGNYGVFSDSTALGYNTNTVIRNNIFVSQNTNTRLVWSVSTNVNSDHNLYFCTAGATAKWQWNAVDNITLFSAWQAASGQDANSIYADPQFVSENPVTAADFRLKPTAPGINAGLNLKAAGLIPFNFDYRDYAGHFIPQGAGTEIGAYESNPDGLTSLTANNFIIGAP